MINNTLGNLHILMKSYSSKFLFFLLCCFILGSCGNSVEPNADLKIDSNLKIIEKPNIIYILADDLGFGDLSNYGQQKFQTPNIDKLASEGMQFHQHYSGSTVCAPSRSSLMTGLHTGHTIIRGNKEIKPEGQFPIPDETFTLAEQLKIAGYTTGAFGKWGLGFPGSEGDPNRQGFDVFFGYNCQRMGHHYYPHHLWSNQDSLIIEENQGQLKGVYGPELIHEKTLEFIEKNKKNPFFLYVPSIIPHAELAAPERNMNKYRNDFKPDNPYRGTDSGNRYRRGPYESQKETHRAFAAMIDLLDEQVGEIVEKVKSLGIEDKTIIVFTSDNGPHQEGGGDPKFFNSNGPLRGIKRDLFEGGIRVPMIVKWPGKIKPGSTSDHVSAFWDVFPTFSEIAGIECPDSTDGISFLPELLGNTEHQVKHEYLYWEFHERGGRQAIRMGDWKAVKYNVLKNRNAAIELYNLATDLGEANNIANLHPDIVEKMAHLMKEARTPSKIFPFNESELDKLKNN